MNDNSRTPGQNIKVNGIEYDLVKDEKLDEFSRALAARQGLKRLYRVTATLSGTFLAGQTGKDSKHIPAHPGYGHMGRFYLFVIRQVSAFDTKPFENASNDR
jgi:hypothetical protein